jgi:hypothetical protein
MKKTFVLLSLLLLTLCLSAPGFGSYRDDYLTLKPKQNVDYASAWQFAKAAFYYGEYIVTDNEQKKTVFSEAKDAGLQAVAKAPNKPEGHYWLGVAYGAWAEANGILNSLQYAGTISDEMSKSISLDPLYHHGSAYMVRGRVYAKAPGWPLSIGDGTKAEADYKQSLAYGPENRKAYRFYAEYLLANGRNAEAKEMIKKGLGLKYKKAEALVEDLEIATLQKL